jgi:hypothetical protein
LLSVLQPELPASMRMMTRGLVSPDIIEHVFARRLPMRCSTGPDDE